LLLRENTASAQELPLLCREPVERASEGEQKYTATFTEEEMRLHTEARKRGGLEKEVVAQTSRRPSRKRET
jgi:hypothetical protein